MRIFYALILLVFLYLLIMGIYFSLKDMGDKKKRRINGFLLLFLFAIILLSLISFIIHPIPTKNIFGLTGYYLSKLLFHSFGLSTFILSLLLLLASISLFKNDVKKFFYKYGAFTLGLFIVLLLSLSLLPVGYMKKGYLGKIAGNFLVSKIGLYGSIILIAFLLFILIYSFSHLVFHITIMRFPSRKKLKKRERIPLTTLGTRNVSIKNKVSPGSQKRQFSHPISRINNYSDKFLKILTEPIQEGKEGRRYLKELSFRVEEKLKDFGVNGRVVNTIVGPVITRFEYKPSPGIKISKIEALADDLAMALRAEKIRILAPIPGKEVVGIEIPNRNREIVFLKELLTTETFLSNNSPLFIPIGKDITGEPYFADIWDMPHLLVAGATGSGKSVFLNAMIASILYKVGPERVRFIMIDPKRIELSIYNGIPHLLGSVITEADTAMKALKQALHCMEERYKEFAKIGVRDIKGYNEKQKEKMAYIIFVIDELADLLLSKGREVESALIRLAQMARAVGIHLVLATQRPSVDVITGLIKANFPSRISFQVASRNDAKTIMDNTGAEKLLGRGDMLFIPPKSGSPIRLHGPYISTEETKKIVNLIGGKYIEELMKHNFKRSDEIAKLIIEEDVLDAIANPLVPAGEERLESFAKFLERELGISANEFKRFVEELEYYPPLLEFDMPLPVTTGEGYLEGEWDELFEEAKRIVIRHGTASASLLQRKLKIGFARAGRLIDQLEKAGIVGPFKGSKSRDVLIKE